MERSNNMRKKRDESDEQQSSRGQAFPEYPDVVSVEEMSDMLGIGVKSAYKLVKDGEIQCFKVGRFYRIPKYHILKYLKIL